MSNLTAIGLSLAILVPYVFDRSDAVVTGVTRGVALSIKYRWMLLYVRFLPNLSVGIIFHGAMAMAWMMVASNIGAEEVKRFAYLMAFFALQTDRRPICPAAARY
jgi:hypothetical protein